MELENITVGETSNVTDPELLMTIMETREALDEAQSEEEVAEIRERNKSLSSFALSLVLLAELFTGNIVTTIQDLSGAFKEIPPDLATAKDLVIQLRYLENVEGICKEWTKGSSNDVRH